MGSYHSHFSVTWLFLLLPSICIHLRIYLCKSTRRQRRSFSNFIRSSVIIMISLLHEFRTMSYLCYRDRCFMHANEWTPLAPPAWMCQKVGFDVGIFLFSFWIDDLIFLFHGTRDTTKEVLYTNIFLDGVLLYSYANFATNAWTVLRHALFYQCICKSFVWEKD